jgi:hypothetical protein
MIAETGFVDKKTNGVQQSRLFTDRNPRLGGSSRTSPDTPRNTMAAVKIDVTSRG